ncbi:hect e3 ubiquitin [Nannochloropsis gaditana]|uniref:Hect e3 ubiquitin n=1 Tax=Nannochloropsis gaditana TaxID=72520 RepID=W7U0A3_9STRA|nr:hect e3 ubiquitin [Nannochloropsis gaditana]
MLWKRAVEEALSSFATLPSFLSSSLPHLFPPLPSPQAVLEHQTLPLALSLPLLKHILGTPLTFSDLELLDPDLYRSLAYIQRCSPEEVEALHLDFTVTFEAVGRQEVGP